MFHRYVLLIGLMICVASPLRAQQDIEQIREVDEALTELDETVTIMARVIKKSIEAEFDEATQQGPPENRTGRNQQQNQDPATTFLAVIGSQQGQFLRQVTGCRGYLLPGAGVVFVVSVDVPLEKVSEDSEEGSLWEEAKREVEGKAVRSDNPFLTVTQATDTAHRFPAGEVNRVRDGVLSALARHGNRLEGIGPDQKIWVTIRMGNRSGTAWIAEKRNCVISVLKQELNDLPSDADERDLQQRVEITRY